jgi:hypothetical protein
MASSSMCSIRKAQVRLVPLQAPRPSLLDLWGCYRFHTRTLARMAEVPDSTILAMFYHQPVHRADAEKVLQQLSMLFHKVYTLSTVAVVLVEDEADMDGARTDVFQKGSRPEQRGLQGGI